MKKLIVLGLVALAWLLTTTTTASTQTHSSIAPVWRITIDPHPPTSFSFRSDLFEPAYSSFDHYRLALPSLQVGNAPRFQFGAVSRFRGWNLKEIARGFHFQAESRNWWKDGNGWAVQDRTIEFRFAIGG